MFDGIDIHQAIPVIRAFTHFALLANVAEDIHRERRRAVHVAAGEPPQDSSLAATYLKLDSARSGRRDGRRRADRRAGVPGDHRASHRDPPPHRVRHPAPHHRADAAARCTATTETDDGRDIDTELRRHILTLWQTALIRLSRLKISGRDRDRAALLPGSVLRRHPAGQRRGARRAAGPLARRRPARRSRSCGPVRGSAATATATRTSPPTWFDWPPAARPTPRWALLRRADRAGSRNCRCRRDWSTVSDELAALADSAATSRPAPTSPTAARCGSSTAG